jgi:hypothetical protein
MNLRARLQGDAVYATGNIPVPTLFVGTAVAVRLYREHSQALGVDPRTPARCTVLPSHPSVRRRDSTPTCRSSRVARPAQFDPFPSLRTLARIALGLSNPLRSDPHSQSKRAALPATSAAGRLAGSTASLVRRWAACIPSWSGWPASLPPRLPEPSAVS